MAILEAGVHFRVHLNINFFYPSLLSKRHILAARRQLDCVLRSRVDPYDLSESQDQLCDPLFSQGREGGEKRKKKRALLMHAGGKSA